MPNFLDYLPSEEELKKIGFISDPGEQEDYRDDVANAKFSGHLLDSLNSVPNAGAAFLGQSDPRISSQGFVDSMVSRVEDPSKKVERFRNALKSYQELQNESPQEKERLLNLKSQLDKENTLAMESLRQKGNLVALKEKAKSGLKEVVDPITGEVTTVSSKLSPAQTSADRKFGEDYSEYVSQGGSAGAAQNLALIKGVIDKLKSGDVSTGGLKKIIPTGTAMAIASPATQKAVEDVRTAVMGALRQTFGAQFTEREGQKYFESAFNPALPTEENINKLTSMLTKLEQSAAAKQKAIDYYQKHGTIAGFSGAPVAPEEFSAGSKQMSNEDVAAIEWAKKNPNDPRSEKILKLHGM